MTPRLQLSMYVPAPIGRELDRIRRLLDPVQADLIPAHVTLCREDELDGPTLAGLAAKLSASGARPFTLVFGQPESFHGHGIRLPCITGEDGFHALRRWILAGAAIGHPSPHITLAHPRNPLSLGNTGPSGLSGLPCELAITFADVFLIRQEDAGPWRVIESFALGDAE